MKMDYGMMTEAGMILVEEIENKAEENMNRCSAYAGKAESLQEMKEQEGRPD